MITTDILIRVNEADESVSSFLAHDETELSWNELVEVGNQLRILYEYVVRKASGQTDGTPGKDADHQRGNLIKAKRKSPRDIQLIEQPLKETARAINAGGPVLLNWLNSDKRRKLQMQSILATSFLESVKKGTHNLKPILGAHKEQVHNRNNSIIWLIYKHVSLAHALLVLYSFSSKTLGDFTFEDIIYLFGYVVRSRESLYCEALEQEARKLTSGPPLSTTPPLRESQYVLEGDGSYEDSSARFSKSPTDPGSNVPLGTESGEEAEERSDSQFATTKRKRTEPWTQPLSSNRSNIIPLATLTTRDEDENVFPVAAPPAVAGISHAMLPAISKNSAYGLLLHVPQGSFYWCDNYGLDVQEQELLRLEAKFFQHSLEPDEGIKLNKIYPHLEKKARGIQTSGSLLLADLQVKKNLEAFELESDAKFFNLLRSGFSGSIRAGKVWGDCTYKEVITFIKQRFGPAYALLIICIFGTGGQYDGTRLTMFQLAKIIQRISQDIRHDQRSLYCPMLENHWNKLIGESTNDCACTPLPSGGIVGFHANAQVSEDSEIISTQCSGQNWRATVMNEDAHQQIDINTVTWTTRRRQFLVLVQFMGHGFVRKDILRRALSPQYRWDRNGDRTTASRTDITEFMELFTNDDNLGQEVHSCTNDGLIKRFTLEDGTQCYSLKGELGSCERYHYPRELWIALFAFVAYIYPRDHALEQSFRTIGKLLMPAMNQLWERLREGDFQDLPYIVRSSFIEASLSACRLENAVRAKSIVTIVRRLQVPSLPPYLAAMLTWQESVSLRWEGNHNESDTVLDSIFHQLPEVHKTDPDIRLHCAYGRLVFSRAENAILRNDFVRAWQYVDHWESRSDPPSTMELKLIRLFNTVFGRVARYTGRFLDARECFERCLRDGDPSYRHIQFHLADIYCELGYAELAKDLLLNDVERLRHTQSQQLKAFRRLALPLAEAHINLRQLNAARYTLKEVLQIYETMKHHDVTDQLGHVRTLISLARVDWYEGMYSGADERLKRATALVESYSTFITRGFDFAFINLFHSVVKRALASELLSEVSRGYFIAGNGTYFFEEISSSAWT